MTTEQKLDERYGGSPRPVRRRLVWAGVAVVAMASVTGLSWLTVSDSFDDAGFDELGYELVDDRTVVVSFQATPPSGTGFACALQALDEDFGVVGWRVIEYPASETITRRFVETVPTLAQATTGTVHSCWAV